MIRSTIPLAVILLILIAGSLPGAIVPGHDPTIVANGSAPDDGLNLTIDTSTNLEWLDLTLSDEISTNDMLAELGPGGIFESFSHASNAQVLQLFQNMGLPTANFHLPSSTSDGGVSADSAIDLLGESGVTSSGIRFSQGTTTDLFSPGSQRVVTIRRDTPDSITTGSGGVGVGTAGGQIGHFLVRPVPEPTSMALGLICLLITGACRRSGTK